IGLLYGLSRALADLSCSIHFAKIATTQGLVTDVFYITEVGGGQVTDAEKLWNIKRLLKAVAADFQEARRQTAFLYRGNGGGVKLLRELHQRCIPLMISDIDASVGMRIGGNPPVGVVPPFVNNKTRY